MRFCVVGANRSLLAAGLLVAVTLLAGCTSAPSEGTTDAAGAFHAKIDGLNHFPEPVPAADWEVTTLDGETLRLSDLKGTVVFIEFMGAGCTACLANLPDHKQMYAEFGATEGFAFVAMDVWGSEDEDDLRNYRDKHDIAWPMAMAPRSTISDYSVRGTPTQYFIDHEGNYHSRGGYVAYESMKIEIDHLLAERAQAAA